MRKLIPGLVMLGLAAPSLALAQDADKKVAGGGALPAGWEMRVDPKDASKPAAPKLATMGPGLHVTSGSAAIYWSAKDNMKGDYTVEGSFTQTKAPTHAEAYGRCRSRSRATTCASSSTARRCTRARSRRWARRTASRGSA